MSNRFLETNYFKSPFVRGLSGSLKSLYSFIICDCTPSGIWSADFEAASLYIGFDVSLDDFAENFINKGKAIPLGKSKYFFPDFIEHQYPKGLQGTNKAHNNIIKDLNKIGALDENNNIKIEGASMVPQRASLEGRQGIGIGNGKGKGKEEGVCDINLFNTMPKSSYFNGLPEIQVKASIEIVRITKQADVDKKNVQDLWNVFKVQNITGKRYYADEDAVYSHFINWIKKQDFKEVKKTIQPKISL